MHRRWESRIKQRRFNKPSIKPAPKFNRLPKTLRQPLECSVWINSALNNKASNNKLPLRNNNSNKLPPHNSNNKLHQLLHPAPAQKAHHQILQHSRFRAYNNSRADKQPRHDDNNSRQLSQQPLLLPISPPQHQQLVVVDNFLKARGM